MKFHSSFFSPPETETDNTEITHHLLLAMHFVLLRIKTLQLEKLQGVWNTRGNIEA
jgi:hypothetical protein